MKINTIDIRVKRNFQKWHDFLKDQGIEEFSAQEINAIDKTYIWTDNTRIVATGSIANNILKYVAIDPRYRVEGSTFNSVISYLVNQAALMGKFHLFVFTKPTYVNSFEHVGFSLLAEVEEGAVLESGTPNINTYINSLPHVSDQKDKKIASIVANANPFTLGHRYLIETASHENDNVYVFVVNQDVSLFTYQERFELVKKGTSDLKNVIVVSGKEYMVSYATFPAYFLKDDQNVGRYQAKLDAELFKNKIAKPLNITFRYLGSEPYSKTTEVYNEELLKVLPPQVKVKIIQRLQSKDDVVTATSVRKLIADGELLSIKSLVPYTTYDFIYKNWNDLRQRIKERK